MSAEAAAWFGTWWPIWAPVVLLILGGIVTAATSAWNRRGGEKAARRNPLPPTWPEMWARLDAQGVKLAEQGDRIDALEEELKTARLEKAEIIRHVQRLEAGYPNPPGPPPRPWKTTE